MDGHVRCPVPVNPVLEAGAYRPPERAAHIDLLLDGNEGQPPALDAGARVAAAGPELLRRYPDAAHLTSLLAARHGLPPDHVLVTAGADDAIDRCMRAFASPTRAVVLADPTFEMIPRYADLARAPRRGVPWPGGAFPREGFLAAAGDDAGVLAVVSPNNPTGAVATGEDLEVLSRGCPGALLLVDLAYGDFADRDLTPAALARPNAVVLRSFSKALGMAGLRVGYALGPPGLLRILRAAGHPYAVTGPSLLLVAAALDAGLPEAGAYVRRAREEREALEALAGTLGLESGRSQGNFVFCRTPRAAFIHGALAGLGISVRRWAGRPGLEDALRVTCPGDPAAFRRLVHALETAAAPEALLFDMDGVLADVSASYHEAVIAAAAAWGVRVDRDAIRAAKALPGSNNDWELTRRLVAAAGPRITLDEARNAFEAHYQGTPGRPGLWTRETLIPPRELLEHLARRLPLGIVTGRPRGDANRFLEAAGIAPLFRTVVCMEDAPLKPDPAPVRLALERLGLSRAWLLGDTPDDLVAARGAGVLPLGLPAPGAGEATRQALRTAGAAVVLESIAQLTEVLP